MMSNLIWSTTVNAKDLTLTVDLKNKAKEVVLSRTFNFADWTLDEERTRYTLVNGFRAWFNEAAAKLPKGSPAEDKLKYLGEFHERVKSGQLKAERSAPVHVSMSLVQAVQEALAEAGQKVDGLALMAKLKAYDADALKALKEKYAVRVAEIDAEAKAAAAEIDLDALA